MDSHTVKLKEWEASLKELQNDVWMYYSGSRDIQSMFSNESMMSIELQLMNLPVFVDRWNKIRNEYLKLVSP